MKVRTILVPVVLIGLTGAVCSATAAQLDEAAITKRGKDEARALGEALLPDSARLGEQWKRPWEVPAAAQYEVMERTGMRAINSEDAFWSLSRFPFGLSESEAAALYNDHVEMFVSMGGAQSGMTQRQFLNYTLAQRQDQDASAAQKAAMMWSVAARGLALQYENESAANDGSGSSIRSSDTGLRYQRDAAGNYKNVRQQVATEMFGARFAGLSDEQLKAAWGRHMTLVRRYTTMSYMCARNWTPKMKAYWHGITIGRRGEEEAATEPVAAATIDLRLIDEERCDELTDLNAADAPVFAERLAATVRASAQTRVRMTQLALDRDIESARKNKTQSSLEAMGWRKKIETQTAALSRIVVSVTPKLFGDNSYVIRITGVSPDPPYTEFGMFTGWIRKGPALAEVSLSGTFSPEEMDRDMDHILSELDAKLASYDSCPAKRLDVMQTVPDVPTLASVPAASEAKPPTSQADAGATPQPSVQAAQPPVAAAPTNSSTVQPPAAAQIPPTVESARRRMWTNDLKGALADAIALVKANPNDSVARGARAEMELLAGDPRIALSETEALVKALPNVTWTWVLRGEALLWNNDIPAARQSLIRATQLDPSLAQSMYTLAGQWSAAGVPSMARLQYSTLTALDPNRAGPYYGLGFACSQLGLKESAIQAFEQYLRLDPSSQYAQTVRQELERLKR